MTDDARVDALVGHTTVGSALTIGEALASAIPVLGGPLAVLVGEIRANRDRRIPDFLVGLKADFDALGTRLDAEYVLSAEFAERTESVLEQVVQATQSAKRGYYRHALTGLATGDRPGDDDWQLLLDALNGLQPIHLRVLARLKLAAETEPQPENEPGFWDRIVAVTPELNDLTRLRCWDGLAAFGILDTRMLIANAQTDQTSTGLITAFGAWFAHFLEIDEPNAEVTFANADRGAE